MRGCVLRRAVLGSTDLSEQACQVGAAGGALVMRKARAHVVEPAGVPGYARSHEATASYAYGYSLLCTRLQPLMHMATGCTVATPTAAAAAAARPGPPPAPPPPPQPADAGPRHRRGQC